MMNPSRKTGNILRQFRKVRRRLARLLCPGINAAVLPKKIQALYKRLARLSRALWSVPNRVGATAIRASLTLVMGISGTTLVLAQAPKITNLTPATNATSVVSTANIEITFSTSMNVATLGPSNILVHSPFRGYLSSSGTFSGSTTRIFNPTQNFLPGEKITLLVKNAESQGGQVMSPYRISQFRAEVQGGSGLFTSHTFGTGDTGGVAIGDLDGDGDLDAIIANGYTNKVLTDEIWLNNGDGTFTSTGFGGGSSLGVAIGDLDNDGDLDAILANYNAGDHVWLNNGDGTFTISTIGGGKGAGVRLGDFDGDGDLDAVVTRNFQQSLIYWNNGSGGFSFSALGVGNYMGNPDVGDLDNDGDLDIVIGSVIGDSQIWWNFGNGAFHISYLGLTHSPAVRIGDLNGDGINDIMFGRSYTGAVVNQVWLNNGNGTFSKHNFGGGKTRGLELGDLDGDGDLDALLSDDFTSSIFLNNGNGTFRERAYNVGNLTGTEVAMGDLNGDGDLDIILGQGQSFSQYNMVYHNLDALTFTGSVPSANQASAPRTSDIELQFNAAMDSTGIQTNAVPTNANVVVYGMQRGHISTHSSVSFINGGNSVVLDLTENFLPGEEIMVTLTEATSVNEQQSTFASVFAFRAAALGGSAAFTSSTFGGGDSRGIALADLDRDGDLDAIVANTTNSVQEVWLNNGDGTFTSSAFDTGSATAVATGDLDGDGDTDAILAFAGGAAQHIWLNNGDGTFTSSTFGGGDSRGIAIGDLDGNGALDALIVNHDGADEMWLNNGDATFTSSTLGSAGSTGVGLADFDGDGDLDMIISKSTANSEIRYNSGGSFTATAYTDGNATGVAVGDFTGDGIADAILSRSGFSRKLTGHGNGTFLILNIGLSSHDSRDVQLGDLDGDGDLDAIFACGAGNAQEIFQNDGAANFSTTSFGAGDSRALALGDLDGDGDLDAIFANDAAAQEVWLNQPQAPTITAVSPNSTSASVSGMRLDIHGTDFEATTLSVSTLTPGGTPDGTLALTPFNATRSSLSAIIPPGYVSTIGTLTLTLGNPNGTTTTSLAVLNDRPLISTQHTLISLNEDAVTTLSFSLADLRPGIGGLVVTPPAADLTTLASISQVGATSAITQFLIQPVTNAFGSIHITFGVSDGDLTSTTSLSLTYLPVNDPPEISVTSVSVTSDEDAATTTLVNLFDIDTPDNTLVLSATSGNTSLLSNSGISFGATGATTTVFLSPVTNANGSAQVTVSAYDGEFTHSTSFIYTVNPVNDPPDISVTSLSVTSEEDTATTALVNLFDIDTPVNTLVLSATSGNTSLLLDNGISFGATGATTSVFLESVTNAIGTAQVTVSAFDGEFTHSTSFSYTVNPVNDPPEISVTSASVTSDEDTATTALVNLIDIDTPVNTLVLSATSGNTSLLSNSGISFGATGATTTVFLSPATNANGSAQVTVTAFDGEFTRSTSFSYTVNPVNDPPEISVTSLSVTSDEDTQTSQTLVLTDIDTGFDALILRASSGNPAVLADSGISFGATGATTTVLLDPVANANGSADVTVSVFDGLSTRSTTFTYTVNPVNDPPGIAPIADVVMTQNGLTSALITIADIDSPVSGLIVTASSANQSLIPDGRLTPGAAGASMPVFIEADCDATGTARITITVSDGMLSTSASFNVDVQALASPTVVGATSVCPDVPFSYGLASPAAGLAHLWSVTGGEIVSGQNSDSIEVVWNAEASGAVMVLHTWPNGCTTADTLTVTPPTLRAVQDFAAVNSGAGASLAVLANDIGAGLTIAAVDNPPHGSAQIDGNTIVYTPDSDFAGLERFAYTIADAGGCSVSGVIVVAVASDNRAAVNLEYVERHRDGVGGVDALQRATAVESSPDGRHIYAAGQYDNAIAIFERNAVSGALSYLGRVKHGSGGVRGLSLVSDVTLSPDGKHLYAAGYGNNAVAVFARDNLSGSLTYLEQKKHGQSDEGGLINGIKRPNGVVVSPDGRNVYATGYASNTIGVFSRSAATGRLTWMERHKDGVAGVDGLNRARGLAFSPDGRSVFAAGFRDNAVAVFERDASTGALTYKQRLKDGVGGVDGLKRVYTVAVSPDSRNVYAAGFSDRALAVFQRNTATGTLSYLERHRDGVGGVDGLYGAADVAVSNDGAHVYAVGYSDNALALFRRNIANGRLSYRERMKDGVGGVDGLKNPRGLTVEPGSRHVYCAAFGEHKLSVFFRNRAPEAQGNNAAVAKNSAVVIPVLNNDSDADGHTLNITGKTDGALGTVSITGGGTTATYNAGALTGADSFTYTVADGHGGSSTATVSVNVSLSKHAAEEYASPGESPIGGVQAFSVSPVPSDDALTFRLQLRRSVIARLSLVDMLGREVALVHDGALESGGHVFEWSDRGQELSSGSYTAVFEDHTDEGNGQRYSRKVVIRR